MCTRKFKVTATDTVVDLTERLDRTGISLDRGTLEGITESNNTLKSEKSFNQHTSFKFFTQ
jgi:hypothetical protein